MSYIARGTSGGPYVYDDGTDLRLYNLPGDRDTTIPLALFDEIAVLRIATLIEDKELEAVIARGKIADGLYPQRWDWARAQIMGINHQDTRQDEDGAD